MRNRILAVMASFLALASCQPESTTQPQLGNLIHPIDTGPVLDSSSIKRIGAYTLNMQNDAHYGADVGDSPEQSFNLLPGKPAVGLVGTQDDRADVYRVVIPSGKQMQLSYITGKTSHNLQIDVWDNAMREIWMQPTLDPDAEVTFEFPTTEPDTFYVIVNHALGGGPYKLEFREKKAY